jgi:dUTP pyrophosphatase
VTPEVRVPIVRVRDAAEPLPLPRYMTPDAAGMDLLADVQDDVTLAAGDRCLVPTGIAVAIPSGFEGQVRTPGPDAPERPRHGRCGLPR